MKELELTFVGLARSKFHCEWWQVARKVLILLKPGNLKINGAFRVNPLSALQTNQGMLVRLCESTGTLGIGNIGINIFIKGWRRKFLRPKILIIVILVLVQLNRIELVNTEGSSSN